MVKRVVFSLNTWIFLNDSTNLSVSFHSLINDFKGFLENFLEIFFYLYSKMIHTYGLFVKLMVNVSILMT